jgi:parvulin-like peptidyl-prolyl isomerase
MVRLRITRIPSAESGRDARAGALITSSLRVFVAILLVAGFQAEAAERPDATGGHRNDSRIAVRVNGEAVPYYELDRMLNDPRQREALAHELGNEDASVEALRRPALRKLVHRTLLLQEAHRRSLTVSDQDVDQAVAALRRRFGDLRGFGEWMQARGLNEHTLFESVRTDALLARVTGSLVQGSKVSEQEIRHYYQAHAAEMKSEEVWLQMIVAKDRARAEQIQAETRKGADFGVLARRESLGRHSKQGGDLGWLNTQSLPAPLREAVASLDPGQAIGPLAKEDGTFVVVRLEQRRAGQTRTFSDAREQIHRHLIATKQENLIQSWLADQERTSHVEMF